VRGQSPRPAGLRGKLERISVYSSGILEHWKAFEIDLIGRATLQVPVPTTPIVELEVPRQPRARVLNRLVGVQIDFLVLHATPQTFDEHVVAPRAFAVHADRDAAILEHRGEGLTGELRTLVGVEDLRLPVARQRFSKLFFTNSGSCGDISCIARRQTGTE